MKIVKAVRIEAAEDEAMRVLNAVLPERKAPVDISPMKIAHALGMSESTVRYNVKKLVRLGYLRTVGNCYEPTEKVLFLKQG